MHKYSAYATGCCGHMTDPYSAADDYADPTTAAAAAAYCIQSLDAPSLQSASIISSQQLPAMSMTYQMAPTAYPEPSTSQAFDPTASQPIYANINCNPASMQRGSGAREAERVQQWFAQHYAHLPQMPQSPAPSAMSQATHYTHMTQLSEMNMSMVSLLSSMSHSSQSTNPANFESARRQQRENNAQGPSPPASENLDPIMQMRVWQVAESVKKDLEAQDWIAHVNQPDIWKRLGDVVFKKEFFASDRSFLEKFCEVLISRSQFEGLNPKMQVQLLSVIHTLTENPITQEVVTKIYSSDGQKLRNLIAQVKIIWYMVDAKSEMSTRIKRTIRKDAFLAGVLCSWLNSDNLFYAYKISSLLYLVLYRNPIVLKQILKTKDESGISPLFKGVFRHICNREGIVQYAGREGRSKVQELEEIVVHKFLLLLQIFMHNSDSDTLERLVSMGALEIVIDRVATMGPRNFRLGMDVLQLVSHMESISKVNMLRVIPKIDANLRDPMVISNTLGFLMNSIAGRTHNKKILMDTGFLITLPNWLIVYTQKAASGEVDEPDLIDNIIGTIFNLSAMHIAGSEHVRLAVSNLLSEARFRAALICLLNLNSYGRQQNRKSFFIAVNRVVRLINELVLHTNTPEWTTQLSQLQDCITGRNVVESLRYNLQRAVDTVRALSNEAEKLMTSVFILYTSIMRICPDLRMQILEHSKATHVHPIEMLPASMDIRNERALLQAALNFTLVLAEDTEMVIMLANKPSRLNDLCNSSQHEIATSAKEIQNKIMALNLQSNDMAAIFLGASDQYDMQMES